MSSRVSGFLRYGLIIALSSRAGFARAASPATVSPTGECADLLTLSLDEQAPLTEGAVREISERLWLEKVSGQSGFIENLKTVTDKLVADQVITRAQADVQFASRVLGEFAPIFSKFVIAELKARQFSDDRIVDFMVNFQDAYGAQSQVDFALAVTRRMLVTVNDASSATSSRGLEQFLNAVAAFGVSSRAYSQFLDVWSHVRTAHPRLVIQFILLNIRNSGDIITAEARARVERDAVALETPAPAPRGWRALFLRAPKTAPLRTLHQVAFELLDDLKIPEFIQEVDGLFIDSRDAPGVLSRLQHKGDPEDVDRFLNRMEIVPPHAWDFLVGNQSAYFSHAQLVRLKSTPLFLNFGEAARARVNQLVADFDELKAAVVATQRLIIRFERAQQAPAPTRVEADPRRVSLVTTSFSILLARGPHRPKESDVASMALNAFSAASGERLTGADFMSIARFMVAKMFAYERYSLAYGVARTLMTISKDYELTKENARDLIEVIGAAKFETNNHFRLHSLIELGLGLENVANWGLRVEDVVARPRPLNGYHEDVQRGVQELRSRLPAFEVIGMTDEDLIKLIRDYAP